MLAIKTPDTKIIDLFRLMLPMAR